MISIYEKFGNYALDISKYVLTGFVLASFFNSMENGLMLFSGILVSLVFVLLAILAYKLQNREEDKKNKNNKKKANNKRR